MAAVVKADGVPPVVWLLRGHKGDAHVIDVVCHALLVLADSAVGLRRLP